MNKKLFTLLFILLLAFPLAAKDAPISDNVSATQIRVGVVVNDVLYAGFSTEPVTHFLPPTTDITQSVKFLTSEQVFTTPNFYAYCMASTPCSVSMKIDFAPDYRKNGGGTNVGLLKSETESAPTIDVTLHGLGGNLNTFYTVTSGTVSGSGAVWCTEAMYLSVGRNSMPDQLVGDYKTVIELELRIQ